MTTIVSIAVISIICIFGIISLQKTVNRPDKLRKLKLKNAVSSTIAAINLRPHKSLDLAKGCIMADAEQRLLVYIFLERAGLFKNIIPFDSIKQCTENISYNLLSNRDAPGYMITSVQLNIITKNATVTVGFYNHNEDDIAQLDRLITDAKNWCTFINKSIKLRQI